MCEDKLEDIVKYAAALYLHNSGVYEIAAGDWYSITDALEGVTREDTWGDIYDIIDNVIEG